MEVFSSFLNSISVWVGVVRFGLRLGRGSEVGVLGRLGRGSGVGCIEKEGSEEGEFSGCDGEVCDGD